MKYLFLLSLICVLFSCTDKKTTIVEKIRAFQDSITAIKRERLDYEKKMTALVYPDMDKPEPPLPTPTIAGVIAEQKRLTAKSNKEIKAMDSPEYKELHYKAFYCGIRIDIFKARIDDLYLELKKY